jgi:hypothetical protein
MRKLIATIIVLLALVDTSVAIAQTVGSRNPTAPPPSTSPDKQLLPEAPVGHRHKRHLPRLLNTSRHLSSSGCTHK